LVAPLFEADFDADGRVDGADLALWQAGFGRATAGRGDGDATSDGVVDGADLLVWQRQNGLGVAAGVVLRATPEPGGIVLALISLGAVVAPRRTRR
jgi:hypothetical protein